MRDDQDMMQAELDAADRAFRVLRSTSDSQAAVLEEARRNLAAHLGMPDADLPTLVDTVRARLADLTFATVAATNRQRCERWHPGFPDDGWVGSDWSNAMAGEAGETCNVVKKLRRHDFGKQQAAADTVDGLLAKLAMEIGDTFMYLDLLAQFYGLDLAQRVVDTFNRVSIREGFPERLGAPDAS